MAPRRHRIAFYTHAWPPGHLPSGISAYIQNVRGGLASMDYDSCVLASVLAERDGPEVVKVRHAHDHPVLRRRGFHWLLRMIEPDDVRERLGRNIARSLARTEASLPIDLIEVEEAFGFSALLQPRLKVPLVVRLHGPWFLAGQAAGVNRNEQYDRRIDGEGIGIRDAFALSAPSQTVLRQVKEFYGIELPNAVVIPNPGPRVDRDSTWRLADCERDTVLFVGRFDRLKGADVLIGAFARLAKQRPAARLLFVGPDSGLIDDSGVSRRLQEHLLVAVSDPGIRGRIDVLGSQPPQAIANLRRRAMVTVVSSRYETLPMTVIEPMAFGCPLVATDVGGISELTGGGRVARLVPSGDELALTTAIAELMANPDTASALAAAGRSQYESVLAPDVVVRQLASFYEAVICRWASERARDGSTGRSGST